MGFGKTFGISLGIYFLLNAIFLLVYAAVGGVGGETFGAFFGLIGDDLGGFFTALLSPSGVKADVFTSLIYHTNSNGYDILANIFGIVWVLVPGTVTAIFAGKLSNESSKSAFFALMLTIFILTVLPIIFLFIPALSISTATAIGASIVPSMYYTPYLLIILAAIFNGAFFGGLAAMFSANI